MTQSQKIQPRFRRFLFGISLLSLHFLSACGSGGSSAIQPRTPSTSISQALSAGEASGSLPIQDRNDTIAGTDADRNGIRDDIDRYINSLPDSEQEKKALRQDAAAIQATVVEDISNDSIRAKVASNIMKSTSCVGDTYGRPATRGRNRSKEIEKLTINTPLRRQAYSKFNQAMSGSVTSMPAGDNCIK
ncbi:MAG: hypothetical protein M3O01_00410 [Pseudomonadota bacterium]|nr:hypothetical protein [Pseudomonadota bacterium]